MIINCTKRSYQSPCSTSIGCSELWRHAAGCCATSLYLVTLLWASPTAGSSLQSFCKTASTSARANRSLTRRNLECLREMVHDIEHSSIRKPKRGLPRSSRQPSPQTQDHLYLLKNESLEYSTRRDLDCLQETVHAVEHSSIRKSNGDHHTNLIIRWPLGLTLRDPRLRCRRNLSMRTEEP